MKNFSLILSTIAVILATVALVSTCNIKNNPTFQGMTQAQLASTLKRNPKMIIDALEEFQVQQRRAQEEAFAEAIAKYADEINSAENLPFVGPKDAKVTVVEFFDFSCGYCKRLAPEIEKAVKDNADVKFVFKPVSFVSQVSPYQAKAGLAAAKQDKFSEFYAAVMGAEGRMDEAAVDAVAKKVGLDMDKYAADVKSSEVNDALESVGMLMQKIQVNGVPTLFVNGKRIQAMSADQIKAAINEAKNAK